MSADPPPLASAAPAMPRGDDGRFNAAVLIAFMLLAGYGSFHHQMWRDEIQAWLIARDSANPWEMVRNLHFDGHPILWYLLIWPGSRLTWNPDAMKPVSLLAATIGVALFLWRGPWSRAEKLLWPFGYYALFEYTIRNRSYSIGLLLLIVFCVLWHARERRIVAIATVLGLMSNVHLYFGVMAAAGGLAIAADRLHRHGWRGLIHCPATDALAAFIFIALALFAAYVAAPPAQGDYSAATHIPWHVVTLYLLGLSIPALSMSILDGPTTVALVLFILRGTMTIWLFATTLRAARTAIPALVFLLSASLVLGTMFHFLYAPGWHHLGIPLLVIMAGIWILRAEALATSADDKCRPGAFRIVLAFQAAVGVAIVSYHFHTPHAHGRGVAELIAANGWTGDPVAGLGMSLTPVCGYLQKRACYYIERGRWSSYMVFDGRPGISTLAQTISATELERLIAQTATLAPAMTLLVPEPWPEDPAMLARHGFRPVARFTGAIEDNYSVYRKDR